MAILRRTLAITCVIFLSSIQTTCGFSLWNMFSRSTDPPTTEDYKYISVDKQKTHDSHLEETIDKNLNEGLVKEGIDHHKPTIKVTRTVKYEITRTVTVNPICLATRAHAKPCFNEDVIRDSATHKFDNDFRDNTVAVDSRESIGEVTIIEPSEDVPLSSDEVSDVNRDSKYIYFRRSTPVLAKKKIKRKEQLQIAEISDVVLRIRGKDKDVAMKEVTETILFTKVEQVINDEVTATLVVDNCIPYQTVYPFCNSD